MTVLKFVFIHFIFDLSVMKKKLMTCLAAAVEKNRDPWIESNLEALSRVELFDTDCFL